MGKMQRNKGARIEREIVNRHKEIGVHAERVVLSGAVKNKRMGDGHDIDVHCHNRLAPLCGEIKGGKQVPKFCTDALGDNDMLFLRPDGQEPIVMMPWRTWAELVVKR
jgi:hypothetical protein